MRTALPGASLALLALWAAPVRAEGNDLASAQKQLAQGEADLAAAGGTCVTMCKALQSMMNAADRICELAKDGPAEDQKRCAEARSKVTEALARVRAACPDCSPGPPLAPSTAEPKKPSAEKAGGAGGIAKEDAEAKAPPAMAPSEATTVSSEHRTSPRVSITIDPLRFFLPAFLVQLRFEKAITSRVSLALAGAYGTLPIQGATGPRRTSATMLGAELRGYVVGRVDGFGVFLSAEIAHRNANLFIDDNFTTRNFVLGLTAGPLIGVKMVTVGGFTFESRVGASYVIDDNRTDNEPHPKIVPNFSVGVGFTL
ncbi:MAG: hypothetical protein ACXVEE_14515 [Polyangiales bacterium]